MIKILSRHHWYSRWILAPIGAFVLVICIVLFIAFTFFHVSADDTVLQPPGDQIVVPDYYSPAWFRGQGMPIKYQNIKEGWSDLPDGGRMYILPFTTSSLPYKNLEETPEWVKHINDTYHPTPTWTPDNRLRMGNYRCMAQSASTVSDWHALLLGDSLPTYQNLFTGRTEQGLNYKTLDAIYYERNKTDAKDYYLNRTKFFADPISHTPVPFSVFGFAQIISLGGTVDRNKELSVHDDDLGLTYTYKPADFHIYQPAIELFRNKAFWSVAIHKKPTEDAAIVDAIHKHGIILAGIKARFSSVNGNLKTTKLGFVPLAFFSGHGVAIVGYVQKDGYTYYVYRETFGLSNDETVDAGVSYRMFPVYGFDEMYTFSQPLTVRTEKQSDRRFTVTVTNAEGRPVDLQVGSELAADNPSVQIHADDDHTYQIETDGHPTKLTIAKDFFYQPNGNPYTVTLD